jgi:hypothetical protein
MVKSATLIIKRLVLGLAVAVVTEASQAPSRMLTLLQAAVGTRRRSAERPTITLPAQVEAEALGVMVAAVVAMVANHHNVVVRVVQVAAEAQVT